MNNIELFPISNLSIGRSEMWDSIFSSLSLAERTTLFSHPQSPSFMFI